MLFTAMSFSQPPFGPLCRPSHPSLPVPVSSSFFACQSIRPLPCSFALLRFCDTDILLLFYCYLLLPRLLTDTPPLSLATYSTRYRSSSSSSLPSRSITIHDARSRFVIRYTATLLYYTNIRLYHSPFAAINPPYCYTALLPLYCQQGLPFHRFFPYCYCFNVFRFAVILLYSTAILLPHLFAALPPCYTAPILLYCYKGLLFYRLFPHYYCYNAVRLQHTAIFYLLYCYPASHSAATLHTAILLFPLLYCYKELLSYRAFPHCY